MDLKEAQQLVDDLEPKIERLKSLYQQYFMGIEKIPPHVLRKDVERSIYKMRRSKIQNTRIRFKFQQLVQRYNTYEQYWSRIMRQIEKGTFKRDLRRAAKRFGQDEALAFAGRGGRAALKGLEEDDDEPPEPAGPQVYELPDPDEFDIDLDFDEDDIPTPPSRRSPRAPRTHETQAVWDPSELYSSHPPPAHPQAYRTGAIPAPVSTQPGSPPPPASQPRSRHPSQNPAPRTGGQPLPVPGASRPPPAPRPPPASPAQPSRPRGGALFGGKARRTKPDPAHAQPGPPGEIRHPPAPQQPRRPGAAPQRPPPAAPRRPGTAPQRPPPPAPGARPSAQQPARRPPAERPAANQRPAPKDDRSRAVYDEYMRARKRTGKGANVSYDAMKKSLEKQADQLKKRHGRNRKVDFEVVEKDGKPLIRPVVK